MKLAIYVLTVAIAIVASLTSGLLIFWAYALDLDYLMALALVIIMAAIPLGAAIDKLEKKL